MSARNKLLAWILVPVLLLLATLLATFSTLLVIDTRNQIDTHLQREASELQLLADRAIDPATDHRFTSAKALLQLYITRTVPDPNETMFVLSEGLVFARSADTPPYRLDLDSEFLSLVSSRESAELGDYQSQMGAVRYLVVPVQGETDSGALVAAVFSDIEFAPTRHVLVQISIISLLLLLIVGGVGWLVAGRMLRPIKELTQAASEINSNQLNRRIEPSGTREFDALAAQFNLMLERIQVAIAAQKRFVDDAGHELRTPITIIRGHLDLVAADPSQADFSMPIVKDELERLSRLVSDLQTLTKSGGPEFVKLGEVDLKSLAYEISTKAKSLTQISVRVEAPSENWMLDKQRITQALLQLIENAAKHTPETGVIQVSFAADEELEISVEDSGSGILETDLERVWEPFYRAKGAQNIEGSGIGLSIVRAIARGHGGNAVASTSSLGGAAIRLTIPRS